MCDEKADAVARGFVRGLCRTMELHGSGANFVTATMPSVCELFGGMKLQTTFTTLHKLERYRDSTRPSPVRSSIMSPESREIGTRGFRTPGSVAIQRCTTAVARPLSLFYT